MNQNERRQYLLKFLLQESKKYNGIKIPTGASEQKILLRGLMNIRMPQPADPKFLAIQDQYLQEETKEKGIVDLCKLTPIQKGIYLWKGDITTLRCDAIVNAANSSMCGCFVPNHACIDNAIHTYAGIQLRLACADLMEKQGHEEPTGTAKITPAFNLPCKYILHTVGPIIENRVTDQDRRLLQCCYRSCLELAEKNNIKSIAFCCISTGMFHFPNEEAARIAASTVMQYRSETGSRMEVIFNVFKDVDEQIYRRLLTTDGSV
ncbi:MAG: protein-ADP-ribose hydrolase [Eubacteriales bacterium]|nr:protein-ADP-ribose hydrolase [Eubacteriales bacterium]